MNEHSSDHQHNVIFVAAQNGYDDRTNRMMRSIESQVRQSLDNILKAIQPANLGISDIAMCRIFYTDQSDRSVIEDIYHDYFSGVTMPPKSLIGASFLPSVNDQKVMVSIEAVVIQA